MCFAVVEIKYTTDRAPPALKQIASKDALEKEIKNLEGLGTVAEIVVFYNHHKHKLISTWADELYKEPVATAEPMYAETPKGAV